MRLWKSRKAAAAILVCLFVSGNPSPAQVEGELDTGFQVTLTERTESPFGIEASLTSTRLYPCAGYALRCRTTATPDTIDIYITGMVRPSPCVQIAGEATGRVYLGNKKIDRTILRVSYRGRSDLHRLLRKAQRLYAVPVRTSFTTVTVSTNR